jgi:drug/metabolite transporter (DMT)-like permease
MSHVMSMFTHDNVDQHTAHEGSSRAGTPWSGMGFALVSAASFGLSGAVVKAMIGTGWSTGAAVTARVGLAAAILFVPAILSLRGRFHVLRAHAGVIVIFGLVAVAGCQLAYFNAVARMDVGVALLIEYAAPVAVVAWLWARRGQRPGSRTIVGGVIAAAGLVTMLGLLPAGGSDAAGAGPYVDAMGVLWALAAMVGAATFFVLSADEESDLPPLVLAASGLAVGALALLAAGALGFVEFDASTAEVRYAIATVPWWLPVLGLGLVAAALPYATGIAAARRLGPRLASFIALTEVVAAVAFAWLLLSELPEPVQLAGGAVMLIGVLVVRLGEPRPVPG